MSLPKTKKKVFIPIKIDDVLFLINSLDYIHLEDSIKRLDSFDYKSTKYSLSKYYIIEKLNSIKKKSIKSKKDNNALPLAEYFTK